MKSHGLLLALEAIPNSNTVWQAFRILLIWRLLLDFLHPLRQRDGQSARSKQSHIGPPKVSSKKWRNALLQKGRETFKNLNLMANNESQRSAATSSRGLALDSVATKSWVSLSLRFLIKAMKRNTKIRRSPEFREKALADYLSDQMTISQLVKKHGVCVATLRRWAREAGRPVRHGGRRFMEKPTLRQRRIMDMARRLKYESVGRFFGMTKQGVSRIVRRWRPDQRYRRNAGDNREIPPAQLRRAR
jgi:transposase-like protein